MGTASYAANQAVFLALALFPQPGHIRPLLSWSRSPGRMALPCPRPWPGLHRTRSALKLSCPGKAEGRISRHLPPSQWPVHSHLRICVPGLCPKVSRVRAVWTGWVLCAVRREEGKESKQQSVCRTPRGTCKARPVLEDLNPEAQRRTQCMWTPPQPALPGEELCCH